MHVSGGSIIFLICDYLCPSKPKELEMTYKILFTINSVITRNKTNRLSIIILIHGSL